MTTDADLATSALADVWALLFSALAGGWARRENGYFIGSSGVAIPMTNGVWPLEVQMDPALVAAALDEVAETGLPYSLQYRPGAPQELSSIASTRGMTEDEQVPMMVLDSTDGLDAARDVDDLQIRQLQPGDALLHARLGARGFEAPEELFVQLMTPALLGRPGVRFYVGEVEGEPVTTCLGTMVGSAVGIFNVATPPEHRGRGYGGAVTARAVADGLAAGATWSFLQSSTPGYSVYKRLGFREVELWSYWVSSH